MRYKDKSGHLPVRDFLKFLFCHTLLHVLVYNQQIRVQKLAKSCDGHYFFTFFIYCLLEFLVLKSVVTKLQ